MGNTDNKIRSFEDLEVWKEARILVVAIYEVTKKFPKEEMFGLVNQMRRATVSVISNIAEGFSRKTSNEKFQFYSISSGSLVELHTQVIIAKDIGYVSDVESNGIINQINKIGRLLTGLKRKVMST